jgi:hypothetical protein
LDLFGFSVPLLSFGSVDKHRGLAWWDFHSLSLTLRRPRPRSQGVPIQLGADKPAAVIQPASRDTPHHTTPHDALFSLQPPTLQTTNPAPQKRAAAQGNAELDSLPSEAAGKDAPVSRDPVDSTPPREKARVGLASNSRAVLRR